LHQSCGGGFAQDADEVRSILINRVDESHKAAGMVVGTNDPGGQQVFGRGRLIANVPFIVVRDVTVAILEVTAPRSALD